MLRRLRELNPALIRRLAHRLFFAVNKIDMAESCEGLGEEETRAYVADLVSHQLGVPGFQLDPDQIFLVSARDALFSRLVLRPGGASQEALDTFRKLAFGKRWKSVTDPEIIRETALEIEAASGLHALEAGLLGFCASRAAVLHQLSIADSLEALLAQVHNLCSASAASLHQGVAALTALVEALSARLADTLAAFDSAQHEVSQVEALVVDEVRARLGRLQSKLEDQIGQVLNPGRPPLAAPQGRWPAAWSLVRSILRVGRGSGSTAPSATEDSSEEELQMRLCELHSTIYLQIEEEVRAFWASLESATNARARQLFAAINGRMSELCAAIEGEVSEALCCRLEPADIRLAPPSAEEFHADLQALFATGIQRRVEQEHEIVALNHTVFVKRHHQGLCNTFEYWEPVTETRRELIEVERPHYSADLANVQAYFAGMVQTTITNSVRSVRAYVRSYLADRLAEARQELQLYADRYRACMQEALDVARCGEAERAAALQVAEARCAAVAGLLDEVQELQGQAEEMLGDWRAELLGDAEQAAELLNSLESASCTAPAAATVAALADLQSGSGAGGDSRASSACSAPPLLAESWLSGGGSMSAAEAAAAYASVAGQHGEATEALLDAWRAEAASAQPLAGEDEEGGGAAAMDPAAEVAVQEDAGSPHQASPLAAAAATLSRGDEGEAAADSADSEADWTVVSGAPSEEEEEEEATEAANPEAEAEAGSKAEPMVA